MLGLGYVGDLLRNQQPGHGIADADTTVFGFIDRQQSISSTFFSAAAVKRLQCFDTFTFFLHITAAVAVVSVPCLSRAGI